MAVTVSIVIKDQTSTAVNGVLVASYDGNGAKTHEGTTGTGAGVAAGEVQFEMNAGTYRLRFFKSGVSITNPQDVVVTDPADPSNTFDITAQTFTLPTSTDANFCTCTGTFIDGSNNAIQNLRVFFIRRMNPPDPQVLGAGDTAKGVLGEKVEMVSDATGQISVDLIRNGEYDVIIADQMDVLGRIVIPDAASANLIHVLYPVVSNVVYNPASPLAVSANTSTTVTLTLTFSSGVTKYTGAPPLTFTSSAAAIATGSVSGTDQSNATLTVAALAAGSATLTPTQTFTSDEVEVLTLPAPAALPAIVVNVT